MTGVHMGSTGRDLSGVRLAVPGWDGHFSPVDPRTHS